MSTQWTEIFFETLAKYVQLYIEACGDPATREQTLMDCEEEIAKLHLHDGQDFELPTDLCWVSLRVTNTNY